MNIDIQDHHDLEIDYLILIIFTLIHSIQDTDTFEISEKKRKEKKKKWGREFKNK